MVCHLGNRRRVEPINASTIFEPLFLTQALPPARYGLYALRGRQSAPLSPPLRNAQASEAAQSDRLQVGGAGNGVCYHRDVSAAGGTQGKLISKRRC
jgi:hypothetical protein